MPPDPDVTGTSGEDVDPDPRRDAEPAVDGGASADPGLEPVPGATDAADAAGAEAASVAALEAREEEGRHATNLELFLDLVFVFAVTQVAAFLADDLTWRNAGRGVLLAWLVWWLWSQFTWLGAAVDLGDRSLAQYLVLLAVPPALLMVVALPDAYGDAGRQFAAAYLVVNLWCLAIQGRNVWASDPMRAAWLRYLPLAALAPVALFAGSFLEGDARVAVWAAVAVFNIASAVAAGTGDETNEWQVDPTHFAERHALFVIISLGEVVVAIGATATGLDLSTTVGSALVACTALACLFWWTYFAYVPDVVEHQLARATPRRRGQVARDLFTFGHFPVVFGLVLFSVVAEEVVSHPLEPLPVAGRCVLAGAVAGFVGGLAVLQWQTVHRVSRERSLSVAGVALVCWLVGPHVDAVVLVVLVGLVVAAQQLYTYRSFVRATMAS